VLKNELRKKILQERTDLPQEDYMQLNQQIQKLLLPVLMALQPKFIHVFLPQRNQNEVDTFPIIAQLKRNLPDATIVSPYILPGTKLLQHYVLGKHLIENKWGIPEPDPRQSELIAPQALDVVLLPLLMFDQLGYRVGYGGGFYDRFLSDCKPNVVKIGLSFFDPVPVIEDINAFDIPMDLCITPNKVWQWENQNPLHEDLIKE
jgi:5-formyltetrahydrofolate cyclo-ligase